MNDITHINIHTHVNYLHSVRRHHESDKCDSARLLGLGMQRNVNFSHGAKPLEQLQQLVFRNGKRKISKKQSAALADGLVRGALLRFGQ